MSNVKQDVIEAHKHSSRHREKLEKDGNCGCFYCLEIFHPNDIESWADDDDTAICPHCGIDSVIGESSGFDLNIDFLGRMKEYWFGRI